jgi:class 3 adenylate cyclase
MKRNRIEAINHPKEGEPITIAITDIHGSTTLWEALSAEVTVSLLPALTS